MQKIARNVTHILVAALTMSVIAGPAFSASLGTKVLRGAAVGFAVTKVAKPMDSFINTITLRHGMKSGMATKVVPVLSVGEKGYIGGAQVSGPRSMVQRVQAVFQYEKNFSNNNYRAKILLPSASINPLKLQRVPKVGVTAIIDVSLDGGVRFNTVGTGIGTGDVIRGAGVLVAVKNFGPTINKALNTITFNSGFSTKVVPMGTIGSKTYLGAAQIAAASRSINKVNALWQYEGVFGNGSYRIKILVPTTSSNPLKMKRVDGAGVTAIVDMALSQQKKAEDNRRYKWGSLGGVFGNYGRSRDDDDRDNDNKYYRHDNGKHKGWYKGKHKGRKHEWVDEKWREKMDERD